MKWLLIFFLFDVSQIVIGALFQSRNSGKSYVSSYHFRRGVASDLY
jgi:hypothetical protein